MLPRDCCLRVCGLHVFLFLFRASRCSFLFFVSVEKVAPTLEVGFCMLAMAILDHFWVAYWSTETFTLTPSSNLRHYTAA
jgi:hypothetical protein